MNTESSRSHSLLTIHVTQTYNAQEQGAMTSKSKMALVDLAGSERLKQISSKDAKQRDPQETASINQSLFALSNVVARLGAGSVEHVPFRDR
jgi:kinesin family protein 18/19